MRGGRRARDSKASHLASFLHKACLKKARLTRLAWIASLGNAQQDGPNSACCLKKDYKQKKQINKQTHVRASPGSSWPSICGSSVEPKADQTDQFFAISPVYTNSSRPNQIPRVAAQLACGSSSSLSSLKRSNPGNLGDNIPSKQPRNVVGGTFKCKGVCPTAGWSIDQYCEVCHG